MTRDEPGAGPDPLRVAVFTSLGVNVGDEFIREGVRAILDRLGRPYTLWHIDKTDESSLGAWCEDESCAPPTGDKYRDADVFIQGGAPVYWHHSGGKHTSLTSQWHRWMWVDRVMADRDRPHPVFLNLGAGSGQPWGDDGASFVSDPGCAAFARSIGELAAVTIVRDPVAAGMLRALGVAHEELPCPAFLAACRHHPPRPHAGVIGVNLMELGGHYLLSEPFSRPGWWSACFGLTCALRRIAPLVFVCHDEREREVAGALAAADERVFLSGDWRDYLDVYGSCLATVCNRVHGAVVASGFGVPSVILGNDSRAQIGSYLGLPIFRSSAADVDEVTGCVRDLIRRRDEEAARLADLRGRTLDRYDRLLRPILGVEAGARGRTGNRRVRPAARLASLGELRSPGFAAFMRRLNAFARPHGLRVVESWSKAWEYPWMWRHALCRLDWRGKVLLDIGSEISPVPWFIASLGAHVHLVEVSDKFVRRWEKARQALGVDVTWEIVGDERLPIADASADVVTSFSVIEHQPDKRAAIDEVVRVLRPAGLFGLSFDVCEPDLGMSFPEWNGRALTLEEFEHEVWSHPGFECAPVLEWNRGDIEPFLEWHRTTAEHHNYVTGAAVLTKRV